MIHESFAGGGSIPPAWWGEAGNAPRISACICAHLWQRLFTLPSRTL